jgi:hypothetical protein
LSQNQKADGNIFDSQPYDRSINTLVSQYPDFFKQQLENKNLLGETKNFRN